MTVLHFLESIRPFAQKGGWLRWQAGLSRTLTCPACHTNERMQTRLSVASPFIKHRRFRLYYCSECGTAHCPDLIAPAYEDQNLGGMQSGFNAAIKFYVEQGAGLESMIAPFFWIDRNAIKSLLEVGCGYGFSLDFASRALGWTVQGIDPSHIARNGSQMLGVPIVDGYLGLESKLEGMPFDLVFSSEVIEHISDPDPFVEVLAKAAGIRGTVLLTTPDIAGLREERAIEEVIALVSPGSHLVLFSEEGLTACLKRAGFAHIKVCSTGNTLYAFAANKAIAIDFSAPIDQKLVSEYLQNGLNNPNLSPELVTSFAGRLLRTQTDAGAYTEAQETFDVLNAHWRKIYNINLDKPDSIEVSERNDTDFVSYSATHPFNLVTALYCGGVLALNHAQDHGKALALFAACSRAYKILEPVLSPANAADLDSRQLAQHANMLCASLTAQTDPAKAVDIFMNTIEKMGTTDPLHFYKTRLEVFSAAANTGDYTAAERLRPDVETALGNAPCRDEFERSAALGLAMMAFNYRFERPSGLLWLRKALSDAPDHQRWRAMRTVWATHAAAYGIELLTHGGQTAFAKKRDEINDALKTAKLEIRDFPVIEALGLAYTQDQPKTSLGWLEKALPLSDEDHYGVTEARITDAKVRIFLDAVNAGDHDSAAKTCEAVEGSARISNKPALLFALGLDALNRRCTLDIAGEHFKALCTQTTNPELNIQGTYHLALVLARQNHFAEARKTADRLYAKTNPHAELVGQIIGNRQAELDAAINEAA